MKIIIFVLVFVLLIFVFIQVKNNTFFNNSKIENDNSQYTKSINEDFVFEIVAQELDIPWALAFLPDKSILVTERSGKVRLIDKDEKLLQEPVGVIEFTKEIGEGGLLGIAIDPDFANNNYIYLYYTYSNNGDDTLNRVIRMIYKNNQLSDEKIIIDKIPGASNHNGGRIKFGPDGALYITTGDAQKPSLAQDKDSLAGKILRFKDEKVEIFSYGHRNPQGITWDENNRLWEVEHGQSAQDEFNLIEENKNYGWPIIRGDQSRQGMEQPQAHSGDDTWAPGGAAFYKYKDNEFSIFFGGLRGQALYEMNFKDGNSLLRTHFKGQFGRIREVILGPDNILYITTSNLDGRGLPKTGDDKVIKINPQKL